MKITKSKNCCYKLNLSSICDVACPIHIGILKSVVWSNINCMILIELYLMDFCYMQSAGTHTVQMWNGHALIYWRVNHSSINP